MLAHTHSVAFAGIHVLKIGIEVQITNGLPAFTIVGLGDKAVAESRERVRAALHSLGLSLPAAHITVNLAPADVVKEGTHYDLPIAIALMGAMGIIPINSITPLMMMGELGLDGSIRPVCGILPASIAANEHNLGFVCPAEQGAEALWSDTPVILAPRSLLELMNHLKGRQLLTRPTRQADTPPDPMADLQDIKGQSTAKRALEIAAAGGHNLLMIGPPGSGKSMLAARLPSIMPPLSHREVLEVSQIHSVAGLLKEGRLITQRPFRSPHHSASTLAMVGGGLKARPGEISLAHRGILFLDELPEFNRTTLESLRQPLETGTVSVARANAHVTYPARFQLVAAMNPCKCGYLGVPGHACTRAPRCAEEYQAKISGPLLDRIDLQIEVPLVPPWELSRQRGGESSATVRERVIKAQAFGAARRQEFNLLVNAHADGSALEKIAPMTDEARSFLVNAAQKLMLSGRGYHRMIRIARTIADMEQTDVIQTTHMAEALSFRRFFSFKKD